ncbi:MAG: glycosyltransferase family 2 protein, partial [Acidimicrobiales bacterium]
MLMSHTPRLTIGMPVRNGARFLVPALESILSQKYDDFRLLILDNDSTDATDEICRDFAARDSRVDYRRNSANIGAARNFSRVFELAEGAEYFKWAACDDVLAPEYLDRCIAALDHDPTLVLCQSSTIILDCDGNPTDRYDDPLDGGSRSSFWRFHTVMWTLEAPYAIFGVARWDALRRTGLIRRDFGTDRACLAELSLQGRFHILRDPMFFQRGGCGERTGRDRYWWDPANRG